LPLWLLGDLFDSPRPDSISVSVFLQSMAEMYAAGLPVMYVEGNHERTDFPWAGLSGTTKLATNFEVGNGILVHGMSFTNRSELPLRLSQIPPETQILLAHQSWYDLQHVGSADGRFDMIPHGLTMLTGDYHVCGTWTGVAANGEPVIAHSPGSTSLQALNEPAAKYFGVLYDDKTVEWVPLVTRQLITQTIRSDDEMERLLSQLVNRSLIEPRPQYSDIEKPILRVIYDEKLPEAYDRIVAGAGDSYHLFLDPRRLNDVSAEVVVVSPSAGVPDLQAAILELTTDQVVSDSALRLTSASLLKDELAAMFKEFEHDSTVAGSGDRSTSSGAAAVQND